MTIRISRTQQGNVRTMRYKITISAESYCTDADGNERSGTWYQADSKDFFAPTLRAARALIRKKIRPFEQENGQDAHKFFGIARIYTNDEDALDVEVASTRAGRIAWLRY